MGILVQHAFGAEYERMLRIGSPSTQKWCFEQGWTHIPLTDQVYPAPFGYSSVGLIAFTHYLLKICIGEEAALMDVDMLNVKSRERISGLLKANDLVVHGNQNFSSCGFMAVRNTGKVREFLLKVLTDGRARDTNDDISARLHLNLMEEKKKPDGLKFTHLDDRWNWYDKYFGCEKLVTHPRGEAINVAFHGMNMLKRITMMDKLSKEIA